MKVELYEVEKGRVYATDGSFTIILHYKPAPVIGGGISASRLESIHALREEIHDQVQEGYAPSIARS